MGARPALSVVLGTFNRAQSLEGALYALARQAHGTPEYEVIVVDNNSTDDTARVVDGCISGSDGVTIRYLHEGRQGVSNARNTGIRAARASIVAFTDDDVRVRPEWVKAILETFERNPDADWAGGRVEPLWQAPPPAWLRDAGAAPLAIVDYGDAAFAVTRDRAVCLVAANLAVRRSAFDRVGLFSTAVQRLRDSIGSTEDHELQIRMLQAGMVGVYEPRVVVRAEVPLTRLSKRYHRVWHGGHGRFYAIMRDPSFERSSTGKFLGVPAHVYRRAAGELAAWLRQLVCLRPSAAFVHELRLRFLMAFARQRMFERG